MPVYFNDELVLSCTAYKGNRNITTYMIKGTKIFN